MLAVVLVALGLLAVSAVLGQAVLLLSGWTRWAHWSPAVGFAVLLILGGQLVWLPGRAVTAGVLVVVLVLAALAWRPVRVALRTAGWEPLAVGLGVVLVAAMPLMAADASSIFGEGINNDMSPHLTVAWWLDTHAGPLPFGASGEPLIPNGYPVGPHGLAALLTRITTAGEATTFTAITVAIPALTALAALGALVSRPRVGRVLAAAFVGLTYLVAAYTSQGAFKETSEALALLATMVALGDLGRAGAGRAWRAVPLGLLLVGTIYVYSFPGVAWLVAGAGVFGVAELIRRRPSPRVLLRSAVPPALVAGAVALIAAAPDIGRMSTFASSSFVRESKKDWGNLHAPIRFREALGMWPSTEFRVPPAHPRVTNILLLLAVVGIVGGLVWWWRRGGLAVPAAVVAAGGIWWQLAHTKSIYGAAKGLVVLSPVLALLLAAPLLAVWAGRERRPRRRALLAVPRALGVILLLGGVASSYAVLRNARAGLGPQEAELGSLRGVIGDGRVLFLGVDDFHQWELRGATVFTGHFLYTNHRVRYSADKPRASGAPLDWDSIPPKEFDQVDWAINPAGSYASAPPANFHVVRRTPSFVLYHRDGPTPPRLPIEPPNEPGALFTCEASTLRRVASRFEHAAVRSAPVALRMQAWSAQPDYAGRSAVARTALPRGTWDVSLQYVSPTGVVLTAPGYRASLPGYGARRGPFWPAGVLHHAGGPVSVRLEVAPYSSIGRLLGRSTPNLGAGPTTPAPIGRIAFSRHGEPDRLVPIAQACGRWVDYLAP